MGNKSLSQSSAGEQSINGVTTVTNICDMQAPQGQIPYTHGKGMTKWQTHASLSHITLRTRYIVMENSLGLGRKWGGAVGRLTSTAESVAASRKQTLQVWSEWVRATWAERHCS